MSKMHKMNAHFGGNESAYFGLFKFESWHNEKESGALSSTTVHRNY